MHTALDFASVYGDTSPSGSSAALIIFLVALYAAFIAFAIYMYVRVAHKAGYSGWYVALLFVPVANIVISLMFVFKEWPVEQELKYLRARVAQLEGGGYPVPSGGQFGGQVGQFGQGGQPPIQTF